MSRNPNRTRRKKPTGQAYPIVIETFRRLGSRQVEQLIQREPTCFNGDVKIDKYKELKPDLPFHFKEIHKIPHIENLHIPGQLTRFGADTVDGKPYDCMRTQTLMGC